MRTLCFTSMLLICLSTQLYSQTWPIGTQNDLSSPFGSRNLGSQNFPNAGYDYDFHRGVDIAGTGTVVAAYGGTVIDLLEDNGETGVVIKDSFFDEFHSYFHITHNLGLETIITALERNPNKGEALNALKDLQSVQAAPLVSSILKKRLSKLE